MAQQQRVQDVAGEQGDVQQSTARPAAQPVSRQEQAAIQKMKPHYPDWPISKPGPWITPVPPGMRPINAIRREQVAEVGYNQETGEPATQSPFRSQPDERTTGATGFDQTETAQEALHRRKRRIE